MDYRERYKLQYGYTDEMLELDDLMEEVSKKDCTVKVVSLDGAIYVGEAVGFSKADDEEDGFATVGIYTKDKGNWRLGVNEIKSIEEIE